MQPNIESLCTMTWRRINNCSSSHRYAWYNSEKYTYVCRITQLLRTSHTINYHYLWNSANVISNEWIVIMYWFLVISNSYFMYVLAYLILIFLGFPILDCRQKCENIFCNNFWRNSIFNVTNNVKNAKVLLSKTYIFFFMKVFVLVKVWNVHFQTLPIHSS